MTKWRCYVFGALMDIEVNTVVDVGGWRDGGDCGCEYGFSGDQGANSISCVVYLDVSQ